MDFLLAGLGVLLFITVIAISIGLHEAGHMVAAKKLGLKVPEFFVGFGGKLFSFKRKGTEYGARMIPLGGYVRIIDDTAPEEDQETLARVAPWKRQVVYAAGPLVNIVLGVVILFTAMLAFPYLQPSTTVESVNTCSTKEVSCGAQAAGMQPGDKISFIDGVAVEKSEEIAPLIKGKETVDIEVFRNGSKVLLEDVKITDNRFGVMLNWERVYRTPEQSMNVTFGFVLRSAETAIQLPGKIPGVVESLFTGKDRDPEAPASIVGAGRVYGEIAAADEFTLEDKARVFTILSGLLNIGLGFINLLPIPPLDGGKMLFAFIDSIRIVFAKLRNKVYKPMSAKLIKRASIVPAVLVLSSMLILIVADIIAPVKIL